MRILWLLPDLGYHAAARQALLVVPELRRLGHETSVAALRSGGGMTQEFVDRDVPIKELAAPKEMPVNCLVELDKLIHQEPFDLVHTWRLPAARAMGSARLTRANRPKLLVSQPKRGGKFNPLDRLLLSRVDALASDVGEEAPKAPAVPLAVETPKQVPWPKELNLPSESRVIVCMGDFTAEHSFRDAIWAFDVLKFVYPQLNLVMIGDGPEREALLRFGVGMKDAAHRVHFLHDRRHGAALLPNAEIVWVPSRKRCGELVALEAQAAGVPVVATNLPGMVRVLEQGRSGVLVPPAEPVELAKATRPILDDPARRQELVKAGRSAITFEHVPESVAHRWANVYAEVAAKQTSA